MLTKSELWGIKGGKTCLCYDADGRLYGYVGGLESDGDCLENCALAFNIVVSVDSCIDLGD